MPSISTRDYMPCPKCGTLNARRHTDCYLCHAELAPEVRSAEIWDAVDKPVDPDAGRIIANRRRHPRIDVSRHPVIIEGDGIPRHEATFRNVSADSIGITTTIPCPVDTFVRVELELGGVRYKCKGVVRHQSHSREGHQAVYLVGITFTFSVPPLSLLMNPGEAA